MQEKYILIYVIEMKSVLIFPRSKGQCIFKALGINILFNMLNKLQSPLTFKHVNLNKTTLNHHSHQQQHQHQFEGKNKHQN